MQRKKSLTGSEKLVYFINVLISICLLVSYVLPFISPEKAPKISLFSLLFPLLFGVNILFLIYWLLKRKKYLILSFFSILMVKLRKKKTVKNNFITICYLIYSISSNET